MDFKELAHVRCSVRRFKEQRVEAEKLALILEAGRLAPTAANKESQRIIVITEEAGLQKIDQCTKYRFNAPAVLLVCFDRDIAWVRGVDQHNSGYVDASIAATHMMLQAADLGLGTTWVGAFDPAKAAELFGLPENIVPVAVFPLGYPVDDFKPSDWHYRREPLEKLVHYEKF